MKKDSNRNSIYLKNWKFFSMLIILAVFLTCSTTGDKDKFSLKDFEIEELEKKTIHQDESGDYFYEDFQKLIEELRAKGISEQEIEKIIQKIFRSRNIHGIKALKKRSSSLQYSAKDKKTTDNSSSTSSYKETNILQKENKGAVKPETKPANQNSSNSKEVKKPIENLAKKEESKKSSTMDNKNSIADSDPKKNTFDKTNAILHEQTSGKEIMIVRPPAETYQFGITKGGRIASFQTINGPEKDYHLVQNPAPNSSIYYFISDRILPYIDKKFNVKELSDDVLEKEFGKDDFVKMKELTKSASNLPLEMKGKGYLEILVCNAIWNKDKTKEIFINPRFLKLKDHITGDKLGFSLYYNSKESQVEMIYSVEGDLHLAVSKDGENFEYKAPMETLNSQFVERDPSISPDGKTIVFASSRLFKSSLAGASVFIAFRNSISEPFSEPVEIPGTADSTGEIFPCLYSSKYGDFIFFKKINGVQGEGKLGWLYSIQIQNKKLLPIIPFSQESEIPFKYMVISYNEKRGHRLMSSFPVNNYDIFRMHLSDPTKVIVDENGKISKK